MRQFAHTHSGRTRVTRGATAAVLAILIAAGVPRLFVTAQPAPAQEAPASVPIVVDTDAGPDDILAIAYLLASPGVRIEAICIGPGLAHVRPGAANVLGLL